VEGTELNSNINHVTILYNLHLFVISLIFLLDRNCRFHHDNDHIFLNVKKSRFNIIHEVFSLNYGCPYYTALRCGAIQNQVCISHIKRTDSWKLETNLRQFVILLVNIWQWIWNYINKTEFEVTIFASPVPHKIYKILKKFPICSEQFWPVD
jgi:hypothetical protein